VTRGRSAAEGGGMRARPVMRIGEKPKEAPCAEKR